MIEHISKHIYHLKTIMKLDFYMDICRILNLNAQHKKPVCQKKRKNLFVNSMYTCIVDSLCCVPETNRTL